MKKGTIIGAIAGDTIGSIYEFNPTKEYHFALLDERMEYTDDSIMTITVPMVLNATCTTPVRLESLAEPPMKQ